ncbi:MAG: hypothetical protein RRY95_03100 [Oscillospiraceae bacterium]
MEKKRFKVEGWTAMAAGLGISLVSYLLLQLLGALLLERGLLSPTLVLPFLAVSCGLAALAGGLFAARHSAIGTMYCALLTAGGFGGIFLLAGFLAFRGITPQAGVLVLSMVLGGVLAGLLGGKKRKRRRARKRD